MSTVGDMKRKSGKIKKFFAKLDSGKATQFWKIIKSADYTYLDAALYKWFVQSMYEGTLLSGLLIQDKVLIINFKWF